MEQKWPATSLRARSTWRGGQLALYFPSHRDSFSTPVGGLPHRRRSRCQWRPVINAPVTSNASDPVTTTFDKTAVVCEDTGATKGNRTTTPELPELQACMSTEFEPGTDLIQDFFPLTPRAQPEGVENSARLLYLLRLSLGKRAEADGYTVQKNANTSIRERQPCAKDCLLNI